MITWFMHYNFDRKIHEHTLLASAKSDYSKKTYKSMGVPWPLVLSVFLDDHRPEVCQGSQALLR